MNVELRTHHLNTEGPLGQGRNGRRIGRWKIQRVRVATAHRNQHHNQEQTQQEYQVFPTRHFPLFPWRNTNTFIALNYGTARSSVNRNPR